MTIHHYAADPMCLMHRPGQRYLVPERHYQNGAYVGPTCGHCQVHHMKTRRYARTAPKHSRSSNAFVRGFWGQIGRSLARKLGFK